MILQPLDTPQSLADYLTDNTRLRSHLTAFLSLKTEDERHLLEKDFWLSVNQLDADEKAAIKGAKSKIAQRMYDRMGSIIVDLNKMVNKKDLVLQD